MIVKSKFSSKNILVTGASGFIGSRLCSRLASIGYNVNAISRGNRSVLDNNLKWWFGDLADLKTVGRLLRLIKPDLIFHLAGHVNGNRDINQVVPTFRNILISTVNLLTIYYEMGCGKVIIPGSLEEPSNPNVVPSSPYAAAKCACSTYCKMFYELYHLPIISLRIFRVYGPGQQDISKIEPHVILSLIKGIAPQLTSGVRRLDWIYIDDLITALCKVIETENLEGLTIDIGSGELVSIRDVVSLLVDLINPNIKPLYGALPDRPKEQERVANLTETFNLLGWRPETSLLEGLKYTIDWYQNCYVGERGDMR